MAGMLELPTATGGETGPAGLARVLADLGFDATVGERIATTRHSILSERITIHVHGASLATGRRRRADDPWRFATRPELPGLPLTTATVKSLTALGVPCR
jgi:hypothetical protein